ncbi:unnamed protein product [Leptidea sinapis]|uniref:Uncharacterized protein n=1 Tax=Leptidea sinapis TaxID=189913 RepID=A0A5E4Q9L3_9NEOP|nr:unnamed protein product [Leptidea sinapis]
MTERRAPTSNKWITLEGTHFILLFALIITKPLKYYLHMQLLQCCLNTVQSLCRVRLQWTLDYLFNL